MKQQSDLMKKKCLPCKVGASPLKGESLEAYLSQLKPGWNVIEDHHLEREYTFSDFAKALTYVNKIGAVAEQEGHHPDLHLSYGKVKVEIWTHKINGLTESDFILAAKCDAFIDQDS